MIFDQLYFARLVELGRRVKMCIDLTSENSDLPGLSGKCITEKTSVHTDNKTYQREITNERILNRPGWPGEARPSDHVYESVCLLYRFNICTVTNKSKMCTLNSTEIVLPVRSIWNCFSILSFRSRKIAQI